MVRNNAIEVENLTKVFRTPGNRKVDVVLNDISFEVPRGTSVAVTGANGSGKTTLLKILSTLYLPDSGRVSIMGMDLVRDASEIRENISFVSPGLDFQRKLTLFLRVLNLFDTLNEVIVYDDTGRAGFTTDLERQRQLNTAEYVNTLDEWYLNMTHYSEPRRIEFGFMFDF